MEKDWKRMKDDSGKIIDNGFITISFLYQELQKAKAEIQVLERKIKDGVQDLRVSVDGGERDVVDSRRDTDSSEKKRRAVRSRGAAVGDGGA